MIGYHLLVVLAALWGAGAQLSPVVHIEQGFLRGETRVSIGGRPFAAFEGVPYAGPPLGERRFKEPVAPKPWEGVWDARKAGSQCLQQFYTSDNHSGAGIIGDEDCLFVNVYTPKLPESGGAPLLDVIVYIHGGAFISGYGDEYGPGYLMDREVVFVTFNYRLGILGFLSTEDEVVPGNNGLKDQTMAIKWVQSNIAAFGGNPKSVTIAGGSAGGASVHYHYLSPLSHGLFKQGIASSGSALVPWALTERSREKAEQLGAMVGCSTKSSKDLVDCLRGRPARQMVQETGVFSPVYNTPITPFGPVVEITGSAPFLPTSPVDVITSGAAQDLPLIFSDTSAEGLFPVAEFLGSDEIMKDINAHFTEIAPLLLDYNDTVPRDQQKDVGDRIRQFYFGEKTISHDTGDVLIKLMGDRTFYLGVERAARLHSAVAKSPIYFYLFSYRGEHSLSEFLSGSKTDYGVCHGDDMLYPMDCVFMKPGETQPDQDMIQTMLHIWTSYATTGVPTLPSGVTWEPVDGAATDLRYLNIRNSSDLQMESSPDLGNRHFWDTLPISERQIGAKIPQEL